MCHHLNRCHNAPKQQCFTWWSAPTSLDVLTPFHHCCHYQREHDYQGCPPGDRAAVPNRVQHSCQDRDGPRRPQKGLPLLAGIALTLCLREDINIMNSRWWNLNKVLQVRWPPQKILNSILLAGPVSRHSALPPHTRGADRPAKVAPQDQALHLGGSWKLPGPQWTMWNLISPFVLPESRFEANFTLHKFDLKFCW